jgi:hypothetical protein
VPSRGKPQDAGCPGGIREGLTELPPIIGPGFESSTLYAESEELNVMQLDIRRRSPSCADGFAVDPIAPLPESLHDKP